MFAWVGLIRGVSSRSCCARLWRGRASGDQLRLIPLTPITRALMLLAIASGVSSSQAAETIMRAPTPSWTEPGCGVPGEYSSGQEVCDARAKWINIWYGPVVFDTSYANQPYWDGKCYVTRFTGATDDVGWPFNGYHCPAGYTPRNFTYKYGTGNSLCAQFSEEYFKGCFVLRANWSRHI